MVLGVLGLYFLATIDCYQTGVLRTKGFAQQGWKKIQIIVLIFQIQLAAVTMETGRVVPSLSHMRPPRANNSSTVLLSLGFLARG